MNEGQTGKIYANSILQVSEKNISLGPIHITNSKDNVNINKVQDIPVLSQ